MGRSATTAPPAAPATARRRTAIRQRVAGWLAMLAMAGLIVAAPFLLVLVAGNPLPASAPTIEALLDRLTRPDDGEFLLWVLAVTGWAAWAVLAGSLLIELVAQLAGRRAPRVLGAPQRLAGVLVATALAWITTAGVSHVDAAYVEVRPVHAVSGETGQDPDVTSAGVAAVATPRTHLVQRGEGLLDIAQRYGVTVERLASANHHRPQPDGTALRPGQLRVYPGWQLVIPDSAGPGAGPAVQPATTGTTAVGEDAGPAAPGTEPAEANTTVHEVAPGDWMWHIAGRYLGDELRYPEIAALNPELAQRYPGFPDHIQPGDRLRLPADADDRGERAHATGQTIAPPDPLPGPDEVGPERDGPDEVRPERDGDDGAAAAPPAAPPASAPAPATDGQAGAPAASTPSPVPGVPAPPSSADRSAAQPPAADQQDHPPAVSPLLASGMVAAVMLGTVAIHRARRSAHRRYGRIVTSPAQGRAEVGLGAAAGADISRLDRCLRTLAARAGGAADGTVGGTVGGIGAEAGNPAGHPLPDIGAVWIAGQEIHLVLATPSDHPPPAPFQPGAAGTWVLAADAELPPLPDALAPLPTLVTVASQPGRHLLVDLERLGMVTITGSPRHCGDLLRHIAAELAHNPWSDLVEVTLAGFPSEQADLLVSLNPDRMGAAASLPAAIARLGRQLAGNREALDSRELADAVHARVQDPASDAWTPRLLLAYQPDDDHLHLLRQFGMELAGERCAIAVVTTAAPGTGRGQLTVTGEGLLRAGFLAGSDDIPAAALPEHLLAPYAELVRQAAEVEDHPIPPAAEPWARGTDATGAPLAVTAGSAAVLRADTPVVPLPTVGGPDPSQGADLDRALDQWWSTDHRGPKVALLGPVRVAAAGPPPDRRQRTCEELAVLLAARGHAGATADEAVQALWGQRGPARTVWAEVVSATRRWLGSTPEGDWWLTDADAGGRYRLRDGVLVDWHLFRRLRTRAGRSGGDSDRSPDLRAALRLVQGPPLARDDQLVTRARYTWLPGTPFDPDLIRAGVIDTAQDLVERCLTGGDLPGARWAVQQAWLADPERHDDHPWRALMRVAHAQGDPAGLDDVVAELLRWRDAEHPDELAPATRELIATLRRGAAGDVVSES